MTGETKVIIGIGVATLAIIVGAIFFAGKSGPQQVAGDPVDKKYLIKSHSATMGKKNAKVTVVEFGDFQCPSCGQAYPIVKQMNKEYQNKDFLFVFRNYPLPQHKNARIAAEAGMAAKAQGKFFEMEDKLYTNQTAWSELDDPMSVFQGYAKQIGLDTDKFTKDVKANAYEKEIVEDLSDGVSAGVEGTPTFYINGQKLSGVPTYDDLKAAIDEAAKH